MDGTLYEYMSLNRDEAEERVSAIVNACRPYGGAAVLLYHNNSIPLFQLSARYPRLVDRLSLGNTAGYA